MAFVGLGALVLVPSISLAQYPGSAGDLNSGAVGASSSASSGSSSASASSSSICPAMMGPVMVLPAVQWLVLILLLAALTTVMGMGALLLPLCQPKKPLRKRALIRQFRLEFAKILTIETANKRPLRALSADVYLDQFSKELDTGLDQQSDLNSLGRDLGLVRDALDDRLDEVIASYGGVSPRRGFFSKTASSGGSAPALRTEIQKLKLKHELLEFGEYSLQAMGYYAK